jgi:hypothetical protein
MNDAEAILNHMVDIWEAPGSGLGRIKDILDDLAARRKLAGFGYCDFRALKADKTRMGRLAYEGCFSLKRGK